MSVATLGPAKSLKSFSPYDAPAAVTRFQLAGVVPLALPKSTRTSSRSAWARSTGVSTPTPSKPTKNIAPSTAAEIQRFLNMVHLGMGSKKGELEIHLPIQASLLALMDAASKPPPASPSTTGCPEAMLS